MNIFVYFCFLLSDIYEINNYSSARLPIGRGVRARKYKAHYSSNYCGNNTNITSNPTSPTGAVYHHRSSAAPASNVVGLNSDEENTSEYSHPPSSEHSTLDSNPDRTVTMMKNVSTDGCSDADDSSSSSDENSSDDDDEATTARELSTMSAARKSNNNVN